LHCLLLFLKFNGISVGAGLPNITGETGYDHQGAFATGAFKSSFGTKQVAHFAGVNTTGAQGFDAAVSSPIYGRSNTVTPLSLTTKLILKY